MHTDLAVIEDTLRRLASVALSPVDQAGCYILASGARNSARSFNVIGRERAAQVMAAAEQSSIPLVDEVLASRVAGVQYPLASDRPVLSLRVAPLP